ncbi:MAG: element excision factor XisH family protein [Trichodesmium sp. MO_231.B1]|nr:element excision factor XisH family protein [Okeania sp. SIO2F4]MDJ0519833.1 element excision factor XisH family protein [Trichodesmium sp. MO_231.B1]
MAKDIFHQQVKNALIKDGWNITKKRGLKPPLLRG